ncbi:hypothetical protein Cme02nite_63630 [Catellatospora methionotrophica]|uniref:histidine kinase n=1 Tax=Catellatospora methionotrophica TaxID=121620 RepID=A0A8J3PHM7_9ACTN|nr:histidine kinase [Catellatospora methionotrophica]GIG18031.1 hypothetical protein Cme02nite_63630 [Catellatospora methionotrophica]
MAVTPAPARRFTTADVGPAVGLALVSILAGLFMPVSPPYRPADALGLALGALAPLALLWRRRAPLTVLAVAGALVPLTAALGYAVTTVQWAAWIALYTCFAGSGHWRRRAVAAALTSLSVGGFALADGGAIGTLDYFGIAMCFLIATVAGDAARSRRAAAEAERLRAAAVAREQADAAERILARERHRLAGELHDALGHAVNVMVMQAGVGRRVFADNPEFAAEALGHIENVGRDALGELDRLLRVLHPDRDGEPATPEPALTDLADLANRVRAAGRELVLNPAAVSLSPSGERALFRIAQEAVTNALRHTVTGRITVDIGQTADTVVLEVVNETPPLPAPTGGRGLVNMRERARLEGGLLEAGPVDGGFRVRAALPAAAAVRP